MLFYRNIYSSYPCALSDIVFSISNIPVDAVVDRYVSSGISGAQRRESEFLRELTSIIETEYYVCHLFSARVILRHLSSMFVFLSSYCDDILSVGRLC